MSLDDDLSNPNDLPVNLGQFLPSAPPAPPPGLTAPEQAALTHQPQGPSAVIGQAPPSGLWDYLTARGSGMAIQHADMAIRHAAGSDPTPRQPISFVRGPSGGLDLQFAGAAPPDSLRMPAYGSSGGGMTKAHGIDLVDPDSQARMQRLFRDDLKGQFSRKENDEEYVGKAKGAQSEAEAKGYEFAQGRLGELGTEARHGSEDWNGQTRNLLREAMQKNREDDQKEVTTPQVPTAKKALNVIEAMFSGFQAGLQGRGDNPALERQRAEVKDEIERQKTNLAHHHESLAQLGKLVDMSNAVAASQRADLQHAQGIDSQAALLDPKRQAMEAGGAVERAQGDVAAANTGIQGVEAQITGQKEANAEQKWAPAAAIGPSGPTPAQIQARAIAIRDKAAANGVEMPIDEARRQSFHELSGVNPFPNSPETGYAKAGKPAAGSATLDAIAPAALGASTNWEGVGRNIQGTDAFAHKKTQERWNAQILGAVHKANPAARGLEAMEAIGEPYLIQTGDSPATIRKKVEAAKADFGKGVSAPPADEKEPAGFEEAGKK